MAHECLVQQLEVIHQHRGQLSAFCGKHNLSYNYVYRLINGSIKRPSYEKAIEISEALISEGHFEIAKKLSHAQ